MGLNIAGEYIKVILYPPILFKYHIEGITLVDEAYDLDLVDDVNGIPVNKEQTTVIVRLINTWLFKIKL